MKNIKQYIMLAATLLFASCSQDEELNIPTVCPQEGDLVEITVGAPQGQNSRVSYDDTSKTPFAWEDGDQIVAVGFGDDGTYKGQEVFTMKGEPAAKATFVGKLTSGATKYKLYYQAAKLTVSTTDGKATIDYSDQAEDVTNPTAHMKNFYLLGTEEIPTTDLLDASKAKTLNLQNSLFRLNVEAMPTELGVLKSITLTTNNGAAEAQSISLAISNATAETKSFVAYMLFDPVTLNQVANKEFVVTFTDYKKYLVHKKTPTEAAFNQSGYRYNLTVDNTTKWIVESIPTITTQSAGTITAEQIKQVVGNTKKLAIVGPINGKDIRAIREAAGCTDKGGTIDGSATVTNLDLSGASIKKSMDVYCNDGTERIIKADNQIDECMFKNSKLTSITLPNTITFIGYSAFYSCASLTTLTFEKGGTEALKIGRNAFSQSGVTEVEIPNRTTSIDYNAFNSCKSLTTLTFEKGGTQDLTIGNEAFRYSGVTKVEIPNRTTSIVFAFNSCKSLTTLTFEKGGNRDLTIGNNAFSQSGVTEVEIPNRTTDIVAGAFQECASLTTLTFEKGGKSSLTIGNSAFYGSGVTEVEIPNRTETIWYSVFNNCTSLANLTFEKGGKNSLTIKGDAFTNTIVTAVEIPERTSAIEKDAFSQCSKLTTITLNTPYSDAVASNISFQSFSNASKCTLNLDNSWSGKNTDKNILGVTWSAINIAPAP